MTLLGDGRQMFDISLISLNLLDGFLWGVKGEGSCARDALIYAPRFGSQMRASQILEIHQIQVDFSGAMATNGCVAV